MENIIIKYLNNLRHNLERAFYDTEKYQLQLDIYKLTAKWVDVRRHTTLELRLMRELAKWQSVDMDGIVLELAKD